DETAQALTMAGKQQQKDWLAFFERGEGNVPFGRQGKQWLWGGPFISTKGAPFPPDAFDGGVATDLFQGEGYFFRTQKFWALQNAAIADRRNALLEAGWADVVVLETGKMFAPWEHEKTPKKKGGKLFISVSAKGVVELHEGWLSRKEVRAASKQVDACE